MQMMIFIRQHLQHNQHLNPSKFQKHTQKKTPIFMLSLLDLQHICWKMNDVFGYLFLQT